MKFTLDFCFVMLYNKVEQKILSLFTISARFVKCVYITLQHSFRELVSCGGLQTSRSGGRREYETTGRAPTCFTFVGRLLLTQTVGRIFIYRALSRLFSFFSYISENFLKCYNIVVANSNANLYNIFVFQSNFLY